MPARSETELGAHFFFVEHNEWFVIADVHWEKIDSLFKIGAFKILETILVTFRTPEVSVCS